MSKELVVKHNQIIESAYTMTTTEAKIIAKLTSMIKKEDEDFKEHIFKVSDLLKELGLGNQNYIALEQSIDKLMSRIIEIKLDTKNKKGENDILKITFVSSCIYRHSTSEIVLRYDPNLKPYFLQLNQNFTKYFLKNILELKSFYSIRIYEMLKQYEKLRERVIEIDHLRKMLEIQPSEYKLYADLKKRVLLTAEKEINEKTDLLVSFEEIKTVRKITAVRFKIEKKSSISSIGEVENIEIKNIEEVKEYPEEVLELFNILPFSEQVEKRKAELAELLKSHTFEYLKSDIEYCNEQRPEKYWGYFIKSVNSGHYSSAELEKAKLKEQQKLKKKEQDEKLKKEQEERELKLKKLIEKRFKELTDEELQEYENKYKALPNAVKKTTSKDDLIKEWIREEMKQATA